MVRTIPVLFLVAGGCSGAVPTTPSTPLGPAERFSGVIPVEAADLTLTGDLNGGAGLFVTVPDVDGDGVSDLWVSGGAPEWYRGRAWLTPSGALAGSGALYLSDVALGTVTGALDSSELGISLASVGPLAPGGPPVYATATFDVGAAGPGGDSGAPGEVVVFHGAFGGDLVHTDVADRWVNPNDGPLLVAGDGGDLTGDGVPDLVVSAPLAFAFDGGSGPTVWVVGSDPAGVAPIEDVAAATIHLSAVYGVLTMVIGDSDGDGQDELLIDAGPDRLLLFEGPLAGDLTEADAQTELIVDPIPGMAPVPAFVDVDGDGVDDLVIYDPERRATWFLHAPPAGPVYVPDVAFASIPSDGQSAWASPSVASVGDLDGDGFDDLALSLGASMDEPSAEFPGVVALFYGPITSDRLLDEADATFIGEGIRGGLSNVGEAADFDGNGALDLVLGAWTYRAEDLAPQEGRLYVFHGTPNGAASTATTIDIDR